MSNITVNIKRLDPTVELPKYAHPTDAGLDLRSNEDCVLKPFERRLVSTGLAIALPDGYSVNDLETLLPLALTTQILAALYENQAGFFGSQMAAMDNATRNAGEVIDKLTIQYNRSRQAMITKELIEIISGAEAL